MRLGLSLSFLLVGAWLLWSGNHSIGEAHANFIISLGLGSCLLVLLLSIRMRIVDPEGTPIHVGFRLLLYGPWLLWEIIKANIDVAKLILSPTLDLSPEMIEVEAFQETDLGRVIYANSITMTPGTVSVDVRGNTILVHAITGEAAEALREGDMDVRAAFLDEGKNKRKA